MSKVSILQSITLLLFHSNTNMSIYLLSVLGQTEHLRDRQTDRRVCAPLHCREICIEFVFAFQCCRSVQLLCRLNERGPKNIPQRALSYQYYNSHGSYGLLFNV